jgi:non-specific serine/threonine protein kinase
LTLSREVGDVLGIAVSLGNLGYATLLQADWERSTSLLGESLTLFREVGDRLDIALTSAHLGFAAVSRGDHRRAAGLLEEGLALSHELGDKPSTATSLEGMARVAGIGSRAHRGARLWGAAHALREDIGAPLPSHERALHEPYVAAVRAELGEGVWEALWEEGRKMSLEVAVEYALSEREAAPSARPTDERKRDDRHSLYLTPREEEVAVLVARGLTNRQIASGLSISEHTAATHVTRILRKLGLDSRSQLAAWMIDQGSHTSGSVYGGPRSG